MVDRARPIRLVRSNDTANGRKHIMVSERGLLSLPVPFVQVLEFDAQDARLNRIEAAVISFDIVEILSRLAVVPQHTDFVRHLSTARCDYSCFAASTQVLTRIKTENGCMSHRAGASPTIVIPRPVLRPHPRR